MQSDKKLWIWLITVIAAVLAIALIAAAVGGLLSPGMPDVPDAEFEYEKASAAHVDDPGFSLNGADYPALPVLQDFIDRGWVPNGVAEFIGDYSEKDGPTNLVAGGYYLVCGEDQIKALLNMDDCQNGVHPTERRMRSLSLNGEDVTSFCLDGKELAEANREELLASLGEPDATRQLESGVIYTYFEPGNGVSEVSFSFKGTDTPAIQIMVVFGDNR